MFPGRAPVPAMQGPQPHHRRRIKLPRPRLQLKMVGAFAGLCVLAMLTQALVLSALLGDLAARLPADSTRLSEAMPGLLGRTLLLTALLVLPGLILIGIRITFRIAGPLVRMEKHLDAVARGEWPGPCRIRAGDELAGLCERLNAGLQGARAMGPLSDDEQADAA